MNSGSILQKIDSGLILHMLKRRSLSMGAFAGAETPHGDFAFVQQGKPEPASQYLPSSQDLLAPDTAELLADAEGRAAEARRLASETALELTRAVEERQVAQSRIDRVLESSSAQLEATRAHEEALAQENASLQSELATARERIVALEGARLDPLAQESREAHEILHSAEQDKKKLDTYVNGPSQRLSPEPDDQITQKHNVDENSVVTRLQQEVMMLKQALAEVNRQHLLQSIPEELETETKL